MFDKNNDGHISAAELKHVMSKSLLLSRMIRPAGRMAGIASVVSLFSLSPSFLRRPHHDHTGVFVAPMLT